MIMHSGQLPAILCAAALALTCSSCDNNTPDDRHWRPADAVTPFMNNNEPDRLNEMTRIAAHGDPELVFFGDSITQGWMTQGKEVWDRFYGARHAVNFGIGMAETGNLLWRIHAGRFDTIHPRLIVLMIGTNNTQYSRHTPQQIADGITLVVQELLTRLPDTKILLLGILPRGRTVDDAYRANNEAVNRLIARAGDDERVFYRDIGSVFLAADGSIRRELMSDPVHLSTQGYLQWAQAIEDDIVQLLGE